MAPSREYLISASNADPAGNGLWLPAPGTPGRLASKGLQHLRRRPSDVLILVLWSHAEGLPCVWASELFLRQPLLRPYLVSFLTFREVPLVPREQIVLRPAQQIDRPALPRRPLARRKLFRDLGGMMDTGVSESVA